MFWRWEYCKEAKGEPTSLYVYVWCKKTMEISLTNEVTFCEIDTYNLSITEVTMMVQNNTNYSCESHELPTLP